MGTRLEEMAKVYLTKEQYQGLLKSNKDFLKNSYTCENYVEGECGSLTDGTCLACDRFKYALS